MTTPAVLGRKLRVLVVDDSMFMRAAIRKLLAADPRLEVCGEAKDGRDAVEKAAALEPDVITMDYNMPRLDGAAAVREIFKIRPVPVVMLSARTRDGARETFDALAAGAVDFLAKPSGEVSTDLAQIGEVLVAKVIAASQTTPRATPWRRPAGATAVGGSSPAAAGSRAANARASGSMATVKPLGGPTHWPGPRRTPLPISAQPATPLVVVVGISTGGPAALDQLLPSLPGDFPHALLIVQHMPAEFTAALAERLAAACRIRVREARHGDRPERGVALIAPGDLHTEIDEVGRLRVSAGPEVHGVRPAADVTMKSVARYFGRRVVGVVMTGLGRDGAEGLAAIKAMGGSTVVQDRESSVIWGMPKAAVDLGVVDQIASLSAIGDILRRLS